MFESASIPGQYYCFQFFEMHFEIYRAPFLSLETQVAERITIIKTCIIVFTFFFQLDVIILDYCAGFDMYTIR